MDFDTGILSLIEGYVEGALSSTGTMRALRATRPEHQFEGDTIPDVMPVYGRPPTSEDFDELTTAVNVQQRLIR